MERDERGSTMPIHDWSRVDAGIFHHFHHAWIEEIARALNRGVLPGDYYAMAEQHASQFGPDVLNLQSQHRDDSALDEVGPITDRSGEAEVGVVVASPKARLAGETRPGILSSQAELRNRAPR